MFSAYGGLDNIPVTATGVSVHQNAEGRYDPSRLSAREPPPVPGSSLSCRRPTQHCKKLRCVLSDVAWLPTLFADRRGVAQSQSRRIAAPRGESLRPNAANQSWDARSKRANPSAWAREFLPTS